MTSLWLLLCALPVTQEQGYEERLIGWGLELHNRERESNPEGLPIEEILVASEDVFSPSDPYPQLLNLLHVRTREAVIRREVLMAPGEQWDAHRVQETERNLRRLFLLAVVKVLPVKGRQGGVALLVVAKDRWSLRLSNSFTLIGSLLQLLQLQLIEVNFNGWGQQLAVNTTIRLDTFSVGQTFVERRLFGTRWYFGESASLIFNRLSGALEGTSGAVNFGYPIITLDQPWGFLWENTWNVRRRRVFRGASVWRVPYPDADGAETVPVVYDVRELVSDATLTRSFGRAIKLNVSASLGGYARLYSPWNLDEEKTAWLTSNYLPRSESVAYAKAYVSAFPADFQVLRNIDSFELSEDYQLGWLAQGGVRLAAPIPWTFAPFMELGASLRYRLHKWDDLLTLTVAGAMRVRPGQTAANQRVAAEFLNYSPPFWKGRLVTRVLVDFKNNDLDNRQLFLGGSTGLRGAGAEQFSGRNMVLVNVEYRARPVELWTNWLGVVLFYDAGSAFDTQWNVTHTVGIGLRLLLPQLNKEVLRVDMGIVIGGAIPGLDRLNASWGQVNDIRPSFLDEPLALPF